MLRAHKFLCVHTLLPNCFTLDVGILAAIALPATQLPGLSGLWLPIHLLNKAGLSGSV